MCVCEGTHSVKRNQEEGVEEEEGEGGRGRGRRRRRKRRRGSLAIISTFY